MAAIASTRLVGLRSRKHISPFALVRATDIAGVCAALREPGRSAIMAGGLDLIDRMKGGETFDRVILLKDVAELRGIRRDAGKIVVGALTTHADLQESALLAEAVPGWPTVWRGVANPRVRHTGTIGGNLMSGLPHYDAASALLALKAETTVTIDGISHGTVPIDRLPDLRDALLLSVGIDDVPSLHLLADRSLHPALSVYLAARSAGGEIAWARIAVGCAYARPVAVDLPLAGRPLGSLGADAVNIARAAAQTLPRPNEDGLASASYRRRMIEVLIRRLLVRLGAA